MAKQTPIELIRIDSVSPRSRLPATITVEHLLHFGFHFLPKGGPSQFGPWSWAFIIVAIIAAIIQFYYGIKGLRKYCKDKKAKKELQAALEEELEMQYREMDKYGQVEMGTIRPQL